MIKEVKNKRIEVRMTEYDYSLFQYVSKQMGLDASKLIRMYIDTSINPLKNEIQLGRVKYEDIQTILNNFIQQ